MTLKEYLQLYDALQDLIKNSNPNLCYEVPEILQLLFLVSDRCMDMMNRGENDYEYADFG